MSESTSKITYQTTDWAREAKRFAAALGEGFEISHPYAESRKKAGYGFSGDSDFETIHPEPISRKIVGSRGERGVYGEYDEFIRCFCVWSTQGGAHILLRWNGQITDCQSNNPSALLLAKLLFHLDLLAPEVEIALKMSITAHEKLEWTREYEERYGL